MGTFAVGMPASFIEIEFDASWLKGMNAGQVIMAALLEMDAAGPFERAEFGALAKGGLESGPELDWIAEDFNASVAPLDEKVSRVTLEGRTAWERSYD